MKRRHTSMEQRGWRGALSLMSVYGPNTMRGRISTLARAAWIVVAVSTLAVFIAALPARYSQLVHTTPAISASLEHFGFSAGFYAAYTIAFDTIYVLGSIMVATLIFLREPGDRMALFVSLFLVTFAASTSTGLESLSAYYQVVYVFSTLMGAIGYTCLNGLFYLFPDGRFVPRWTWIVMLFVVLGQVPFSLPPTSPFFSDNWPAWILLPMLLGFFGTAVFAQVYRYRRVSDTVQRQQTKWVVYGATAAVVVMFAIRTPSTISPSLLQDGSLYALVRGPALNIGWSLIPLSIGIAILRHRLWDIDVIINRTLVYGALTACVVGIYVLIVGGLGTILEARGNLLVSLVAAGLVAALFMPLRDRLQRGVNRLMYGERDDPYTVLSLLGQRLEATLEPHAVLPAVAETVAHALKLPHVAIELERGDGYETAAECGRPVGEPLRLLLVYGTETVGRISLSPRAPGEPFGPADRRLLDDLARQAGIAAHAVCLTADLQRSRERLITAREEERRRLRRDLHDGLGPALSSAMLKLGAARRLLPTDSPADDLIVEVREDMHATVSDVRRLVYDLRPPALDQLGLVPAIRDYGERCGDRGETDGEALPRVTVDAPERLPPLPAAVEVAAYHIVREALTNVARHARARSCRVSLTLEDAPERSELRLEIADDGAGLPTVRRAGVGLSSMRERAEELGGACTIGSPPGGGTLVLARLPVGKE